MEISKSSAAAPAALPQIVWDNHACMPLRPEDVSFLPQLERVKASGVDVISLNIGYGPFSIETHFRMLAQFRSWITEHSDAYALATTVDAILEAKSAGKLAITFDIEGAGAVSDQLSLIKLYYDLGVRWMLIAYNENNGVGGGCYQEDGGLTDFGRATLREMNKVGMVICCSHTGERSALEAMDWSSDPVIFSHSNPSAVYPHTRNIGDDVIRRCAARGGVVGINGIGPFLSNDEATAEKVANHIDYVAQLVGPQHVGIGLDYVFDIDALKNSFKKFRKTFPDAPEDLSIVAPEQLPLVAQILSQRGYPDEAVHGVMGNNWLRIAKTVWK